MRRRDAEQWMSHRLLPDHLRERIRRHEQYKWQETRGVDEDNLIRNLPKDLRRDIKRHLCLALLMRVCFSMIPVFLTCFNTGVLLLFNDLCFFFKFSHSEKFFYLSVIIVVVNFFAEYICP